MGASFLQTKTNRICRYAYLTLIPVLFLLTGLRAQVIENAGDYMTQIAAARTDMDQKYLAYLSAAAHSRRTRRIEKLRMQTLESIGSARSKTSALPKFEDDNSLRQASIDYIQACHRIFGDDYSRIVNMEETAGQSVDQMQTYLQLQEQASEKLEEAFDNLSKAEKDFAARHGVTLVETKNELGEKMASASQVSRYCDRIYILFFKCNWEDGQLFNALNSHKLSEAEQARTSLIRFSEEGLNALNTDSLKSYKGNSGLKNGCRQALEFYNRMAKHDIPKLTDFYLKQENFGKIKKKLDAKGSSRTQEDVDEYNKAVREMNADAGSFNQLTQSLNKQRQEVSQGWEAAEQSFRDDVMPYYK